MATICQCANCGHRSAVVRGDVKCPLYCKDCKTPEKRKQLAEANAEIQNKKPCPTPSPSSKT